MRTMIFTASFIKRRELSCTPNNIKIYSNIKIITSALLNTKDVKTIL